MTKHKIKIHKEMETNKMMKTNIKIHNKTIPQKKKMKQKINYAKISSSSLKSIYNKIESKQNDAIKKRKTVKKNKHIFLNKKKTKKKEKKHNSTSGGAILGMTFGRNKEKKLINNYTSKSNNIRNTLFKYTAEFKKIFNLYKNQQTKLKDNYIEKFNNNINAFFDGIIDQGLTVDTIDKKSKSAYNLMKKRMTMLNKIYRFSTAIGQKMASKERNALYFKKFKNKLTTFNINRPKNFYYKSRHSRTIRTLKLKDSSKIKRNFAVDDNLWGTVAVYREYELKLEKIKSEIKTLIIKHEKETKNITMDIKRLIKARFDKTKKDYKGTNQEEDINLVTKEELDKLKELKKDLKPIYDEYNKNLDDVIHFYIPKIKITNMNLILMDLPKKKQFKYGNVTKFLTQSNIEYEQEQEYDTSKKDIVNIHEECNKALFDKSVSLIDIYFNAVDDIIGNKYTKYMTNYLKFHDIQRLFHNIGILYLYNLEKKPYIDIGQVSMLNYESKIDASLIDIKKNEGVIYLNNMDYYNNILHLPRFVLNHLKVCMLKSSEVTYDDDFYRSVNVSDKNAIDNIKDKKLTEILVNTGVNKFKSDKLGLKLEAENKTLITEVDDLEDDSNNKIELNSITGNTNDKNDSGGENNKSFFLPISTYHAMFSIRDFSSIKNIKFKTDFFKSWSNPLYKSSVKINNKDIKNGAAISKLFYINGQIDVLPGTIIYLYKQIAFNLHFVLSKDSRNDNLLYNTFLKQILNFSLNVKTKGKEDEMEKNIKRNIGIFTGIDKRKIYVTYVMIVYLQHLNRLLECVTDLEYLTEKLFHTYKKDTDARKIFREEINRISKQKDYSVSSENIEKDGKLYGFSDLLSDNEINEDIKTSTYEYKKLMYKIKRDVDSLKSLDEINDLIQAVVANKKSGNIKPRISLKDYYDMTREGKESDKFNPEDNIFNLYLEDPKVKAEDDSYFKSLIETMYLDPNSSEVGGHDNELLKDVLNIKQDKQPDKINTIQTELYYLILYTMDKNKRTIMKSIRKLEVEDSKIKDHIEDYLEEEIKSNKGSGLIPLKDIYKDINIENKMILMNKFNLLHKDNFMFFTNKMYKDKRLLLTSLLASLPTYNKEYIHTDAFGRSIKKCETLLSDMEKIDADIKTKIVTILKEDIISTSKFLLVTYKDKANPNIEFNIITEPLTPTQNAFINQWKIPKNLSDITTGGLVKQGSVITAIEKEGLNETTLEKIPDIILGHNTFKEKIIEDKRSQFEDLFKKKHEMIKLFNKEIMLVSLFKILIDKLLKNEDTEVEKQKGEHKSIGSTAFNKRSDVFYPMQFIFLDSNKPYEEDKYNYLQYSKDDDDFKDKNKIDDILSTFKDEIIKDYEKIVSSKIEDKSIELDQKQGLDIIGITTFKKSAIEHFENIKNNILDNIKDDPIFVKLVNMKSDIKTLETIIQKYDASKEEKMEQTNNNIDRLKKSLNDFFKIKIDGKDEFNISNKPEDRKNLQIFDKIIEGYEEISIDLRSLSSEESSLSLMSETNVDKSLFNAIKSGLTTTAEDRKIDFKQSGELINGLKELYKKNIKTVSDELVNWNWRKLLPDYFKGKKIETTEKALLGKDGLQGKKEENINKLILIIINGFLNNKNNDEYIKRTQCETTGDCGDAELANQTFIPFFISKLKENSVSGFLDSSDVIFSDFKEKITDVTENFKEKDLGKKFNDNIERLLTNILTKIKENFILVDRMTLEDGANRY